MTLWPGGSLVSGDITDGGASATGSVTTWTPGFPATSEAMAEETTLIDLGGDGRGYTALEIVAFLTGTPSATPFNIGLNLWVGLYFPLAQESSSQTGNAIAQVTQLTWTSVSTAMTVAGEGGPFTEGAYGLSGPTSAITNYFRPPCYTLNDIPRDGSNIGAAGYARDMVVTAATSNLSLAVYTIPFGRAIKAAYRVNSLLITDADMDDVSLQLGYALIRGVQ